MNPSPRVPWAPREGRDLSERGGQEQEARLKAVRLFGGKLA